MTRKVFWKLRFDRIRMPKAAALKLEQLVSRTMNSRILQVSVQIKKQQPRFEKRIWDLNPATVSTLIRMGTSIKIKTTPDTAQEIVRVWSKARRRRISCWPDYGGWSFWCGVRATWKVICFLNTKIQSVLSLRSVGMCRRGFGRKRGDKRRVTVRGIFKCETDVKWDCFKNDEIRRKQTKNRNTYNFVVSIRIKSSKSFKRAISRYATLVLWLHHNHIHLHSTSIHCERYIYSV